MKLLDAWSRFQKEYAKIGVRELVQNIGKEAHQDLRQEKRNQGCFVDRKQMYCFVTGICWSPVQFYMFCLYVEMKCGFEKKKIFRYTQE